MRGGPPPAASPLDRDDPARIEALLGRDFALTLESGCSRACHEDAAAIWDWYARGFGPMRALIDSLDADRLAAFRRDLDAYHEHYRRPAGLCVERKYRVIVGRRR